MSDVPAMKLSDKAKQARLLKRLDDYERLVKALTERVSALEKRLGAPPK